MCLAVPGRVLSVEEADGTLMAEVDFGGVRKGVCLEYVPDARVGEYVLVHVGFAIQRLDEQSAMQTLADFGRLGLLEEEFGDGFALAAEQAGEPREPTGPTGSSGSSGSTGAPTATPAAAPSATTPATGSDVAERGGRP